MDSGNLLVPFADSEVWDNMWVVSAREILVLLEQGSSRQVRTPTYWCVLICLLSYLSRLLLLYIPGLLFFKGGGRKCPNMPCLLPSWLRNKIPAVDISCLIMKQLDLLLAKLPAPLCMVGTQSFWDCPTDLIHVHARKAVCDSVGLSHEQNRWGGERPVLISEINAVAMPQHKQERCISKVNLKNYLEFNLLIENMQTWWTALIIWQGLKTQSPFWYLQLYVTNNTYRFLLTYRVGRDGVASSLVVGESVSAGVNTFLWRGSSLSYWLLVHLTHSCGFSQLQILSHDTYMASFEMEKTQS